MSVEWICAKHGIEVGDLFLNEPVVVVKKERSLNSESHFSKALYHLNLNH
jgi:hypothetical protein